ncbi:MAG: hypothetical protein AAF961_02555, partial [Planctomycetota bacterium]
MRRVAATLERRAVGIGVNAIRTPLAWTLLCMTGVGCSGRPASESPSAGAPRVAKQIPSLDDQAIEIVNPPPARDGNEDSHPAGLDAATAEIADPPASPAVSQPRAPESPPAALRERLPSPLAVDLRRAAAAGIRYVDGPHLRLFTDLPPSPAVDALPSVFAAAVPLWAEYFGIAPSQWSEWRVQGFLVDDRERFASLGLAPKDNPNFRDGYAHADEFWMVDQPSDYYRRHLMLHEGTHCFMYSFLGACGPGWYMEGNAEFLGTHDWSDGALRLGVMPPGRKATPMWGRIKLVRDAFAERGVMPIEAVLSFDNRRALTTEQYAWAWNLVTLLDQHPRYQAAFRQLQRQTKSPQFNELLFERLADQWSDLRVDWRAQTASLDYGYDVKRMAIEHLQVERVGPLGAEASIDASRGWQSTGMLLEAGREYRLLASGRYQVADDGQPWISEANGVT